MTLRDEMDALIVRDLTAFQLIESVGESPEEQEGLSPLETLLQTQHALALGMSGLAAAIYRLADEIDALKERAE